MCAAGVPKRCTCNARAHKCFQLPSAVYVTTPATTIIRLARQIVGSDDATFATTAPRDVQRSSRSLRQTQQHHARSIHTLM